MTVPGAHDGADEDMSRWREVARLREEHPGWVIVWLGYAGQYKAYRRMPGARRDTALAAATPAGLARAMLQAEQAARPAGGRGDIDDQRR